MPDDAPVYGALQLPYCSFWADGFTPVIVHRNQRGATLIAVSPVPMEKIEAHLKRMQWTLKRVSSGNSTFNFDVDVSFASDQRRAKRTLHRLSRRC
jgi:predicted dithiol-disulfide oxidoreductase (DUF899 family)